MPIESLSYELAIPQAIATAQVSLAQVESLPPVMKLDDKIGLYSALGQSLDGLAQAAQLRPRFPHAIQIGANPGSDRGISVQVLDEVIVHMERQKYGDRENRYMSAVQFLSRYDPAQANFGIYPHLDVWQHCLAGVRKVEMYQMGQGQPWQGRVQYAPVVRKDYADQQRAYARGLLEQAGSTLPLRNWVEHERAGQIAHLQGRGHFLIDQYGIPQQDFIPEEIKAA